jgi:hypothetical protein
MCTPSSSHPGLPIYNLFETEPHYGMADEDAEAAIARPALSSHLGQLDA